MAETTLPRERYFDPDPAQQRIALALYDAVAGLPLICPHGHVDAQLFVDPDYHFANPAELLIIPDHYVLRMLYAHGIPLEKMGVHFHGTAVGEVETDPRQIWQTFAEYFHLYHGTPTGIWLREELVHVFGISEKLSGATAQAIYDVIEARLAEPAFRPRQLYDRFNVEVLCTTDGAADTLAAHAAIRASDWDGDIRPTFRPDAVVNLDTPGWRDHIADLAAASGVDVHDYDTFIEALEVQRTRFKDMGATATDHAATTPYTAELTAHEADRMLQRALRGESTQDDARRFTGHMLIEMARMSVEDGLVMQLHPGSWRNHNQWLFARFGPDMGADIPIQVEFTVNLHPLLQKYGNDSRLTLILFTLDETTYSRELAPLAGHYPAVKLGPPWWFNDSLNGMRRYFDRVMETTGIHNTAGFNDDTRAFPSIPARHDLWRRASANWLGGLVVRGIIDEGDAAEMAYALAYGLAKTTYNL